MAAALFQSGWGLWFGRLLRRTEAAPKDPFVEWPEVAILLPLRGADPRLAESLKCLLHQDYPGTYRLHVVVDSRQDTAWEPVAAAARTSGGRLDYCELTQRRMTCSLQCSAFLQAIARLSPTAAILVTVDGDLMPHATWLRELIGPLADERVGVTYGNRWFLPDTCRWGTLVRYLWNVAAVVPMALFGFPWGGCMAMRREALVKTDILQQWSQSMVHDAAAGNALLRSGWRSQFVPSLMMVIREPCGLSFCFDFLVRQLLWTRLYHGNWWVLVSHAAVTTGVGLTAVGLAAIGIGTGDWVAVGLATGALAGYAAVMAGLIWFLEASVRRVVARREESLGPWTAGTWGWLMAALPVAQLVHTAAVVMATVKRRVIWRGLAYRIRGAFEVELESPIAISAMAAPVPAQSADTL